MKRATEKLQIVIDLHPIHQARTMHQTTIEAMEKENRFQDPIS